MYVNLSVKPSQSSVGSLLANNDFPYTQTHTHTHTHKDVKMKLLNLSFGWGSKIIEALFQREIQDQYGGHQWFSSMDHV